ncbi:MAG TPA: C39 family peptidase [Thermoanaerobaculia bacterium]|nr:C39 family peptidase [Thermoanaerobaculia bacterium]
MHFLRAVFLCCVLLFGGSVAASDLGIAPVYQQTPVWCWAAVGEMVFEHYGVANINPYGNFQCGIIALIHPVCNQNCGNCIVPAGSLSTMNNMLTGYPRFASKATDTSTRITTRTRGNRLSLEDVQAEIDAGRPIVAGISPSGYRGNAVSEHVALIVGYEDSDLIVNDPFPFSTNAFTGDPYEAAGGEKIDRGQYRVPYRKFVSQLQWKETIYGIRCSGSDCTGSDDVSDDDEEYEAPRPTAQLGHSCATPALTCGPFYNQPALPLGSACWCGTPYGPSYGRVVKP